jgi:hypothetical protein
VDSVLEAIGVVPRHVVALHDHVRKTPWDDGKFSNPRIYDTRAEFSIYESKRSYCKLGTFPEDMDLLVRIKDFIGVNQGVGDLLLT